MKKRLILLDQRKLFLKIDEKIEIYSLQINQNLLNLYKLVVVIFLILINFNLNDLYNLLLNINVIIYLISQVYFYYLNNHEESYYNFNLFDFPQPS